MVDQITDGSIKRVKPDQSGLSASDILPVPAFQQGMRTSRVPIANIYDSSFSIYFVN